MKRSLLFSFMFLLVVQTGWSQSIWTNPITASNPSTQNPYTTDDVKDANITVSGIGRGSGIAGNAGGNRYNATGWTTATSANENDYFSFTLTPNNGHRINFVSLVYTLQLSNAGPSDFEVRSSLDNYASNIEVFTSSGTTEKTLTLTAAAFQNVTTSITFRIYGYNADSANGTASINDFTFNGTSTTLGLGEFESVKRGFSIFPNPSVKGMVRFNITTDIEVYDFAGKLLASEKETDSLNTSGFVNGIYIIKTSEGFIQRLIIQ